MKRKNQAGTGVARLSAAIDVPLLADGKPPTEFRIFRAGANDSDYGQIVFDDKAATMVLAADQEKGNPLYFDWNHGMAQEFPTREDGAAAGTFKLAVRNGELWAVDCQWTTDGAEDLEKRRYNLFSPAFAWKSEGGIKRPTKLFNCALVNLAGLAKLNPIAASADLDLDEGDDMTPEQIKKLQDDLAAAMAEIGTLRGDAATRGVATLAAVVGVSGGELEVRAAVTALAKTRGEVLLLTGQTTDAGALGVLQSWKGSHDKVATLSAKLDGIEQAGRNGEFKATLDKLVTEKKITPAFRKDFWETKHAPGGNATAEGLEMLRGFAGSEPTPANGGEVPQPMGGVLTLGGETGKMNKLMGVDPVKLAKWEAEQAASRAHQ